MREGAATDRLAETLDGMHADVCARQREMLRWLLRAERAEVWRDDGARDMAHWVAIRYDISEWKARRWIAAAHTLETLPRIDQAFRTGQLGIDKVVELTRFATPETEARLIPWARGVSCAAIRHRGDLAARRSVEEAREVDSTRLVEWWYFDDGKRFGLQADLPAAQGAVVARGLERVAEDLPVMPGEEDRYFARARRADALVALCSARIAEDADADRATVVVHAQLKGLWGGESGCEIEGGPVIQPQTAMRLLCNARVQAILEDDAGEPLRVGRIRRDPPPWMLRQLRYRDRGCTFPGCGSLRFAQAHHLRWWRDGGTTELQNLAMVCTFHHKLVHEYGWRIERGPDGALIWHRSDGRRYHPGPSPPTERSAPERILVAAVT